MCWQRRKISSSPSPSTEHRPRSAALLPASARSVRHERASAQPEHPHMPLIVCRSPRPDPDSHRLAHRVEQAVPDRRSPAHRYGTPQPCACQKPHPCSLSGMVILLDESAETTLSIYGEGSISSDSRGWGHAHMGASAPGTHRRDNDRCETSACHPIRRCRRYASLMKVASRAGNHDRPVPPCSSWRLRGEDFASTARRRRAGSRNDTSPRGVSDFCPRSRALRGGVDV
jgi:hypothetical protein